ncbi:DgyrCDS2525 [Dimorphilus gyrociliatus]|uniref:DgyrCDS2525 n=1 Tax=Dimorphilus gyrociliatus TaxID=2664684 RepID=A0A7I8VAJ9_9ANNE|nr:DgyrCDS2525 [Dimorphilus gyrociliatus]
MSYLAKLTSANGALSRIQLGAKIEEKNQTIEVEELKNLVDNEISTLKDQAKETQSKLREIEMHYRGARDELVNRRKVVLEAEIKLDMVTQELGSLKQQCEMLKIWNVDRLLSNEGYEIMKEYASAWSLGLTGREQRLNFNNILKDILNGQNVDFLLNEKRIDLQSIFNPRRDLKEQRGKFGKSWEGVERLNLGKTKVNKASSRL